MGTRPLEYVHWREWPGAEGSTPPLCQSALYHEASRAARDRPEHTLMRVVRLNSVLGGSRSWISEDMSAAPGVGRGPMKSLGLGQGEGLRYTKLMKKKTQHFCPLAQIPRARNSSFWDTLGLKLTRCWRPGPAAKTCVGSIEMAFQAGEDGVRQMSKGPTSGPDAA